MTSWVLRSEESRRELGGFRVLVDGSDTAHELAVYAAMLPPGGPPLHVHDFDEALFVIEGTLLVDLEGQRQELHAGEFAWMAAGSRHTFANPGPDPVQTLGLAIPDGILDLFEDRNDYLAGLADGQTPDPERMAEIYTRHASNVVGPPLLDPLGR